jgi:glucosamine--fructose-6-phosphate aminotransferase (isomerizing)
VSNNQEIKASKVKVVAVVTLGGNTLISSMADLLVVSAKDDMLLPLLMALPTQLLSYFINVLGGLDLDKPRNLVKKVPT